MSTVGSIIEKELYGSTVLPLPKYDEKKDYITPYSASGAVYAIPTSARDAGVSAAYVEILAIKSVSGNSEIVSRLVKEYMHNGNSSRMLSYVMKNPVIEYEPYLVSEHAPDFTTIVYNAVVNENYQVTTTIRKTINVVSKYLTKLNDTY
jgi:hypothetical protein